MTLNVPAIRGRMGSVEFFQAKMRARELTSAARPASEQDAWASIDIEDRIQRQLNTTRVREEIAPYLAQDPDRFFGSILVLVQDADTFEFEALSAVAPKLPAAYRAIAEQVGTLTIDGGELIVLDGQHRFAALRMIIQRTDDDEVTGPHAREVANDELVVVFVSLDKIRTRKIFNKINKTAKQTTLSDNIITSEVDGPAIVARRLIRDGAVLGRSPSTGEPLVNWKTNTLTGSDSEFTTLSAVYQSVKDVASAHDLEGLDEKSNVTAPPEELLEPLAELTSEHWQSLISMPGVVAALDDKRGLKALHKLGANYENSLLLRPAAHIVMVKAGLVAQSLGMTPTESYARMDRLDWSMSSGLWDGLLLTPSGRVVARAVNYSRASALLAYLVAGHLMPKKRVRETESLVATMLGRVTADSDDAQFLDPEDIYQLPKPLGK